MKTENNTRNCIIGTDNKEKDIKLKIQALEHANGSLINSIHLGMQNLQVTRDLLAKI